MRRLPRWVLSCSLCFILVHASACTEPVDGVDGMRLEIVGGDDTDVANVPWQIALLSAGYPVCGGSIIDDDWILTAQHCVSGASPSSLAVVAGVTRLSEVDDGQVRRVAEIVGYPGYTGSPSRGGRDVALLRLESALDLSTPAARAIGLVTDAHARGGATDPGVSSVVSGWGSLASGGRYPDVLQSVAVPIVSSADASQAYGRSMLDDQLVAGLLGVGGKDACQGDSGGPLAVPDPDGAGMLLAGVVSWGRGCASARYPGVYARVSYFAEWIERTAGLSTPDPDPEPDPGPDPEPDPGPSGAFEAAGTDLPLSIPDDEDTGIRSGVTVPAGLTAVSAEVDVAIDHSYRGDLRVALVAPDGTRTLLHDRDGGSADDVRGTFAVPAG